MRIAFRALPGISDVTPRPVADVRLQGLEGIGLGCLLDTGSLHNRFAAWVAREAGLDLAGIEPVSLGVGGRSTIARTSVVTIHLGELAWDAPVSFCDPWPWDFQILGQEGFFRYFRVIFDAADRRFEVELLRSSAST